ncbi:hypothetical protein V5799_029387 [Amblyomma americanum]|uniref:Uncharacterized protein n=1 Tax=Amblyomma americanum TaxID=6943 RepID=A0AAQ4ERK6_AMBAM
MQYNTEAECASLCKGPNAIFLGCFAPGSGDACPVDVIRKPYFAFHHSDGRMRCHSADISTINQHRCFDEKRRSVLTTNAQITVVITYELACVSSTTLE